VAEPAADVTAAPVEPIPTPALATIVLPDGKAIELPEGSPLLGLASFLKTPDASQLPKSFEMPGLSFEGAAAGPATVGVLEKLAELLKGFVNARIRLVGYASDSGNADADKQAGLDRANWVKDFLVKAGVPAERLEADGQGAAKPIPLELQVVQ
jgi:hypothetical protein